MIVGGRLTGAIFALAEGNLIALLGAVFAIGRALTGLKEGGLGRGVFFRAGLGTDWPLCFKIESTNLVFPLESLTALKGVPAPIR